MVTEKELYQAIAVINQFFEENSDVFQENNTQIRRMINEITSQIGKALNHIKDRRMKINDFLRRL